ncbi:MAG: T9SS type A sorting domain-containing protein [Saprospiraceae bacterium]|nr:T9SS type A sorting domain-containing protein [Saprospiraceae bacterium]
MKNKFLLFLILFATAKFVSAQTILEADGPGNTYELINSVFAPGFDVIEVPDCNHGSFSRHIDEVFDVDLNKYVFQFHIHTTPDNDRCTKFDRQRTEIKTYDKSPDSLLATLTEKVEYKWKFKLDSGFQPSSSFTHIHQIKAVGGSEQDMPLITLTPRKGNPDKMQLRYAAALSQSTIHEVNLVDFKGVWVEAKETIIYNETGLGAYEIVMTKVAGGDTLFYYTNNSIRTWKTDASFLRPKWGIYRSLNDSTNLRDEAILFADFSIEELDPLSSSTNSIVENDEILIYPNPTNHQLLLSEVVLKNYQLINIYNSNRQLVLSEKIERNTVSIAHLENGLYFVELKGEKVKNKTVRIIVE